MMAAPLLVVTDVRNMTDIMKEVSIVVPINSGKVLCTMILLCFCGEHFVMLASLKFTYLYDSGNEYMQ